MGRGRSHLLHAAPIKTFGTSMKTCTRRWAIECTAARGRRAELHSGRERACACARGRRVCARARAVRRSGQGRRRTLRAGGPRILLGRQDGLERRPAYLQRKLSVWVSCLSGLNPGRKIVGGSMIVLRTGSNEDTTHGGRRRAQPCAATLRAPSGSATPQMYLTEKLWLDNDNIKLQEPP